MKNVFANYRTWNRYLSGLDKVNNNDIVMETLYVDCNDIIICLIGFFWVNWQYEFSICCHSHNVRDSEILKKYRKL